MINIRLDESRYGAALEKLYEGTGYTFAVLESIGNRLEQDAKERHRLRVDPDGQAWAVWADSTRESYPFPGTLAAKSFGKAGNGRLLDRYGDMLGDLNYQVEDDSTVQVGFGSFYATFHEYGTKHMPRRGLLMSDPEQGTLSQEDERSVLEVVNTWLDDILK